MKAYAPVLLVLGLGLIACESHAIDLPPSCAALTQAPDNATPLKTLRKQVEQAMETDPTAAFALLCNTIPRVERERGADSVELAWWTASLATPLIAYMDKFDEALPPLEYARPIFERHYGRYGEALGDIHVAYAWIYMRQGKLTDCGAAWTEALKVRERFPGLKKVELQKVLVGLAQVQLSLRDFAASERNLNRARAILMENGEATSEAGAAIENVLINVAFRQERYEDARRHAMEQLRIEDQLKDGAAQLVPAYALLGRVLERLNEYEEAEQALRHAVNLAEGMQGPLQRHRLSALYQLASLLDQRGHPAEARDQAERALVLGEKTLGAHAPRLVPVLQTLGDAEHQLGDLPGALHRFERAGEIIAVEKANLERPWLVDYYHDLGALQLSLGDTVEGEQSLAAGLESAGNDPTLAIERAQLLLDQARAAADLGGSQSQPEALQALALFRGRLPESHPAILRTLDDLCALELRARSAQTPYCDETLGKLESARDFEPGLRASIYGNQSRLAQLHGDLDLSLQFAVRSTAAAESAGTPEPLWQAYLQLAEVQRVRGQSDQAIFFGKQSLVQIQRERSHFVGSDQRFDRNFLRDKLGAYRRVADWLLEAGRIGEGLAVLKLMKTEELSDFGVRGAVAALEHGVDFTREELEFRDRYLGVVGGVTEGADDIARLSTLEERDRISAMERDYLHGLLAGHDAAELERAQRLRAMLNGAAKAAVNAAVDRSIDAPALTHIAQGFGSDTAFAVYLLAEDHLRVLVSIRGHQAEFRTAIDAPALRRDIGHFLDDIAQRRDTTVLAQKLYSLLVRPVDELAAKYRAERLVLWLDGPLRYVPIAALRDGQRYLQDKYTIQIYAPAAESAPSPRSSGRPMVRGFGVTQAIAGFPALPAVADEMCYVVRGPIEGLNSTDGACPQPSTGNGALEGRGFVDAAFTAERFEHVGEEAEGFSVLHIGTHFRLWPGNALRSFLLLGDGSKLTLDAIGSMNFRAVDVVTLSACETGMGGARTDDGREVEGLSALVQRRGAGRVIASLWAVDDVSTAQLMRSIYQSFASGHVDAALGLQQAQRALRKRYADPFYWAGFYVAGNRP